MKREGVKTWIRCSAPRVMFSDIKVGKVKLRMRCVG